MIAFVLLAQLAASTPAVTPRAQPVPTTVQKPPAVWGQTTPVPGSSSLSGFAKGKKINPKALAQPIALARVDDEAPSTNPATTTAPAASGSDAEDLWRGRAEKLKQKILDAREAAEEEKANSQLPTPSMHDPQLAMLRDAAAASQHKKIAKLEKELAQLAEDCRKTAGCQPGWVR
jgi:hypothetical protein